MERCRPGPITTEREQRLSVMLVTVFEMDCFISALGMQQQRLKRVWLVL